MNDQQVQKIIDAAEAIGYTCTVQAEKSAGPSLYLDDETDEVVRVDRVTIIARKETRGKLPV